MTAYDDGRVSVHLGDCLDVLRSLPDASVDAVVTDPPYGLEFMGKEWDRFAPRDRKNATVWDGRRQADEGWQEAAAERSGKGGGGPSYRSQHKGAKRCDLCGKRAFSGSPCVCPEPQWVIEHRQEAPSSMLAFQAWCTEWSRETYRVLKPGGHMLAFGGTRTWHRLACAVEDAGFEVRDSIAWLYGSGFPKSLDVSKAIDKAAGATREASGDRGNTQCGYLDRGEVCPGHDDAGQSMSGATVHRLPTAPATPDAERWQGWGTALKPAFEPVVVARKPLQGTVAANVLAHGTGALNVDACRIDATDKAKFPAGIVSETERVFGGGKGMHGDRPRGEDRNPSGRWPANVVLDESQAQALDEQSGVSVSRVREDLRSATPRVAMAGGMLGGGMPFGGHDDKGGASRFFYVAKAPKRERPRSEDGTAHPTVKPLDLMRWLVRLVTPPGGLVLDPFAGSGTTVEACIVEGFRCLAIEREADYLPLILQRINRQRDPLEHTRTTGGDLALFELDGESA